MLSGERQSVPMSKIKKGGLDQYDPKRFERLILAQSEKNAEMKGLLCRTQHCMHHQRLVKTPSDKIPEHKHQQRIHGYRVMAAYRRVFTNISQLSDLYCKFQCLA